MKMKFVVGPLALIAIALAGCSSGDEASEPLELSAGGDDATAMCIRFDPTILADMPVAFEGTATAVEGEQVTLEVDHWFTGGDADEVRLTAPDGLQALLGGLSFEVGEQYLISATDGHVNYCGFSGPSSPELRAGFEAAFES